MKSKLLLCIILLTVFACKKAEGSYNEDDTTVNASEESSEDYPDGTYCADIDYYNPDTGTTSTYTLNVEVESHEVTVIHWPNGGWLDSTHFSPEELDSSGSCSFTSYDGKQYDIQISGPECSFTDDAKVLSDEEESRCSQCGGDKETYDNLCWSCERKEKRNKEDIEEHTCKRCGQYDNFMFSTDEMCSDCERKVKEEEDRNN